MSFRSKLGAALAAVTLLISGASAASAAPAPITFADISSNNAAISLQHYKAEGHSVLAVKVNEGGPGNYVWWETSDIAGISDSGFLTREAHKIGLRVLYYDFVRPDECSSSTASEYACGAAEAKHFLAQVATVFKPGDRIAEDYEVRFWVGPAGAQAFQRGYQSVAANAHGQLIVYSYWDFFNESGLPAVIGRLPFWLAAYQGSKPSFHGLNAFAWQYTDAGTSGGIRADESVLLQAFASGSAKPTKQGIDPNRWHPNTLIGFHGVVWYLELRGRRLVKARVPTVTALALAEAHGRTLQNLLDNHHNGAELNAIPTIPWSAS